MVQVLPYVQSPLEQLNPYIQQFSGQIGQGLEKRALHKQTQSIYSQLENPELTDINKASLISQLPKDQASNYINLQKLQAYQGAQAQKNQQAQAVQQQKQLEKEQERQKDVQLSNNIKENIKYSGPWSQGYVRGTPEFEGREILDTSGLIYADKAWASINRGTMSDFRVQLLKEKLAPNSKLTPEQNEARTKVLDDLVGVTPGLSSQKAESYINKRVKQVEEIDKKSSKLSLNNIWK